LNLSEILQHISNNLEKYKTGEHIVVFELMWPILGAIADGRGEILPKVSSKFYEFFVKSSKKCHMPSHDFQDNYK